MPADGDGLKRGLGLGDVVALGLSAAIGVSVFSVMSPATEVAGPAMLIALAIAAVPMTVFVVVYAFMGSAAPRSGSSYDWPAQFVHPYLGFIVNWLRIMGNVGALHLLAVIFVQYLNHLIVLPAVPVMLVLLVVFFLVNLVGVAVAGRFAFGLALLKLAVLGAFIVLGLPHIEAANFEPFTPHGAVGVLAAAPLLIALYSGIESAAEAGEEVRNSKVTIGVGLAISAVIGLIVYFGTSVVGIGLIGADAVANTATPLVDAGRVFLGDWSTPLIAITALVSVAAAINTTYLIFARFLFAMGRDHVLAPALSKVHPRWGTPYIATCAVFVFGLAGLFLPQSLVFLFLAANVPTVLKYLANCWAASRLASRHPELHASASFKLSRRSVLIWSRLGIVCALVIFLCGLGADWRAYAILGVWGLIGTLYWWFFARHASLTMRRNHRD